MSGLERVRELTDPASSGRPTNLCSATPAPRVRLAAVFRGSRVLHENSLSLFVPMPDNRRMARNRPEPPSGGASGQGADNNPYMQAVPLARA